MSSSRSINTSYSTRTGSLPTQAIPSPEGCPPTGRRSAWPRSRRRPRTAASTIITAPNYRDVICTISESRGVSPTVGLAIIDLTTAEVVLCQICDSQTYVRTLHKISVYGPSEILMSAASISKSKLYPLIEHTFSDIPFRLLGRNYWSQGTGLDYIQRLAFTEDIEAIKLSIEGNHYAICCAAAALKYTELERSITFPSHSLRMRYEPSEGSMMIDRLTLQALELIQNLQSAKSKHSLFGILDSTTTPMGGRLLRNNILQPLIDSETIQTRYEAVTELMLKGEIFSAVRQALKSFPDGDRLLTALILKPSKQTPAYIEQSINMVIMLKQFVKSVKPIYEALIGATSELLATIRNLCAPEKINVAQEMIDNVINDDITYAKQPLDLRNQRTYAVRSGVNGFLDIARQTYKEANADVYEMITALGEELDLALTLKYDAAHQFYLRFSASEVEERSIPQVFINVFKKRHFYECQTLDLLKFNQKIVDAHNEVVLMSDAAVQELIDKIHGEIAGLFKICESIAMLDMMSAFAHNATTSDYVRPELTDTLAIKAGRHAIREKIHSDRFIPNDVYASQQSRFQIITGCNMSGKSTYIRSIALMTIMAQIGSFVPAQYASFPIAHQLFARVSIDDCIEANTSSFSAEMRETAFILRNVNRRSMVIIDELGRGTSTRDGLAIALAVAEALVESMSLVWFVTHFRDLATIMAERNGVVNLHLAVEMANPNKMKMLYKISDGCVEEKFYGLTLARVMDFPPSVIEIATAVSRHLNRRNEQQKKRSKELCHSRRQKLVLSLCEALKQARDGPLEGKELAIWLSKLQNEFINRIMSLEEADSECKDKESTSTNETGMNEDDDHSTIPFNGYENADSNISATNGSQVHDMLLSEIGAPVYAGGSSSSPRRAETLKLPSYNDDIPRGMQISPNRPSMQLSSDRGDVIMQNEPSDPFYVSGPTHEPQDTRRTHQFQKPSDLPMPRRLQRLDLAAQPSNSFGTNQTILKSSFSDTDRSIRDRYAHFEDTPSRAGAHLADDFANFGDGAEEAEVEFEEKVGADMPTTGDHDYYDDEDDDEDEDEDYDDEDSIDKSTVKISDVSTSKTDKSHETSTRSRFFTFTSTSTPTHTSLSPSSFHPSSSSSSFASSASYSPLASRDTGKRQRK